MATPGDKKACCSVYEGNNDAKGYSWLGAGRGTIIMANIFLNAALLNLAVEAAGCELGSECKARVYGFYPASWIANIASISALIAGFVMPVFGAIVDFTDYRRAVGISTAGIMIAIQAVQIYTVMDTWFVMLILQAVAIAVYYMQLVSIYAYLPDVARDVGEFKMAKFTATFQMVQFGSQLLYLIAFAVIILVLSPTAVGVARISQAVNTVACLVFFGVGWFKYLGSRKAVRTLPEGHSMLLEGFRNNFKTMKSVQKDFKKGIRWFFLALTFSQAAAQACTSLCVIYLTDSLQLGSFGINIFFLVTLLCALIGCPLGAKLSQRFNPMASYQYSCLYLVVALSVGLLTLEYGPKECAHVWAVFVGIGLGWLYAVEPLCFSMILPVGQEAELSGFYNFVSVILGWLPPLIFTIATENQVEQKYAVIAAGAFFLPAFILLMFSGTWEEVLEEAKTKVENAVSADKTVGMAPDKDEEMADDKVAE